MVNFLRKLNLWVIFFTLLAYIAPFVSPQTMSFLLFIGLAYPWLLLLNAIFVFLWAASRMRYWWHSLVCILLGWNYFTTVIGINFTEEKKISPSIKVMTYNMGAIPNLKEQSLIKFNKFIKDEDCDIICGEEIAGKAVFKEYNKPLTELVSYPFQSHLSENTIVILSKYPILNQVAIPLPSPNESNGCTFADIQINDKIVRVYAIHLKSNTVSGIADDLLKHADYEERATYSKAYKMLKLVRNMAQIRAKQAEILANHIATSPYPVIVCGDFNDIPVSYTYRTLSQNLNDAFEKRGFGFGTTYLGNIPALKIDYILTDKRIKIFNCNILKVPYSDHYPMVSELGLP